MYLCIGVVVYLCIGVSVYGRSCVSVYRSIGVVVYLRISVSVYLCIVNNSSGARSQKLFQTRCGPHRSNEHFTGCASEDGEFRHHVSARSNKQSRKHECERSQGSSLQVGQYQSKREEPSHRPTERPRPSARDTKRSKLPSNRSTRWELLSA